MEVDLPSNSSRTAAANSTNMIWHCGSAGGGNLRLQIVVLPLYALCPFIVTCGLLNTAYY